MTDVPIVQPTCPGCGAPPLMGLYFGGGTQAFCPTDECETWVWNPAEPGGGDQYVLTPEYSEDGRSVTWRPVPLADDGQDGDG